MTHRLLLVEPSATMRYVLEKHASSLGFTVDAVDSYATAMDSLTEQYQHFGAEYSGMLLGWPSTPQDAAAALSSLLEQDEYKDLAVVVMSTDMRAETRAWVAGRDNTALLSWKNYQNLEALLQRLIDVAPTDTGAFATKFDNSDIHLLVVDDSATIRFSLRDLFQMQGYKVSLAATQQEALDMAVETAYDIAVLDFYLAETTGDLLCRELIANQQTGDIVCTVLTGTYSDHIIKRSLRAGAVECMFKNESSELLLSRIDAISRFVRQRRVLQTERVLLEEIIDCVAGAVVVVGSDHRIEYLNPAALTELQLDTLVSLVGQPSETLFEVEGLQISGSNLYSAVWRLPDGESIEVDYEHMLTENTGRSLVRFARKKIRMDATRATTTQDNPDTKLAVKTLVEDLDLNASSEPLLQQMQLYLSQGEPLSERISLFVLDVFTQSSDGKLTPLALNDSLQELVSAELQAIYKRAGHIALLRDNRYAFLLRHSEEAQAYLLVRKIMQICLEIEHGHEDVTLACTGSLLSLNENAAQSAFALLEHAFKGVDLVSKRAPNQSLLLDLRRMLSAYAVTDTTQSS